MAASLLSTLGRTAVGAVAALGAFALMAAETASAQALIRDAEIEDTLRVYTNPLLDAAGLRRDDVRILIVNEDNVNAFVAGGQNIFVNTGLIMRAETPNEIIGVLAHETGHISGGHLSRSREAMNQSMGPMLISIGLAIVTAVFSGRLVARTEDGARALGMALAYRNTLRYELKKAHTVDEAVEQTKSRLPWITTPDLLTVWAVAFGLKDEIDDLIKETFETAQQSGSMVWAPAWYAASGGISSVGNLASSIGSMSTTPSSSSGSGYGGGGGGGGGGSGGGF